jgi:hypothetical protein
MIYKKDFADLYNRDPLHERETLTVLYAENDAYLRNGLAFANNLNLENFAVCVPDKYLPDTPRQVIKLSELEGEFLKSGDKSAIDILIAKTKAADYDVLINAFESRFGKSKFTVNLYVHCLPNMGRIKVEEQDWDIFRDFYFGSKEYDYYAAIKTSNLDRRIENGAQASFNKFLNPYIQADGQIRRTVNAPVNDYDRRIVLIGPSTIYSALVEDKNSIASVLQAKLNGAGKNIRVENRALVSFSSTLTYWQAKCSDIKSGDIVVSTFSVLNVFAIHSYLGRLDRSKWFAMQAHQLRLLADYLEEIGAHLVFLFLPTVLDKKFLSVYEQKFVARHRLLKWKAVYGDAMNLLKYYMDRYNVNTYDFRNIFLPLESTVFHDEHHFGDMGCKTVGEHLYAVLKPYLCTQDSQLFDRTELSAQYWRELRSHLARLVSDSLVGLSDYCNELKAEHGTSKNAGAIVMNCNPFTLGHRYLIEYAASKVEKVYVFVVEEDLSVFPFADRIELIRQGTKDLANVLVIPSGKFIISSLTFPDYFIKGEILADATVDTSIDLLAFACKIAPALGITTRFVGEEPLDHVTSQYNEQMQDMLPQFGVAVDIIPRKERDGGVISASRVRKLLDDGNWTEIAKLVPDTTFVYLKNRTALT